MGFLQNLLAKGQAVVKSYSGDDVFLKAAASAAANVTAADGSIDDSEINSAIAGMQSNEILKGSYSASKLEEELSNALQRAKTRAGRMDNRRYIEAVGARSVEQRQDIFLIAADVADNDGIGPQEDVVLADIAKSLGVDKAKLLS